MKTPSLEKKKLHAKYSASGSERWLNCSGSVALSEKAPPQEDSVYAVQGTEAHTVLEVIMKNYGSTESLRMLEKQYPRSMIEHAVITYEHIIDLMPQGASLLCETKVSLEFVERGMFGTTDAAIVDLFGTLWVIDYKYGAGRLVDPAENSQMIYYALGIAYKFDFNFSKIRLAIAQPRMVHKDGFFRTWDMRPPELMGWVKKFKDGVERCKKPDAPLTPGRWCWFCPAQSICPAVGREYERELQSSFEEVKL